MPTPTERDAIRPFGEDEHADDEMMVLRAQNGDERALEELLGRYRAFTRQKARSYFLSGSEKEDVVQEGMIGLYKAIRDYRRTQGAPFASFAELCISRQIFSAIKYANRRKHQALNTSISMQTSVDDEGATLEDTLMASPLDDPAEMIVSMEDLEELRDSIREDLTQLEGKVLHLYMEGKSYEEIAVALGGHLKSIDNALQRIKRKLRQHLAERDS